MWAMVAASSTCSGEASGLPKAMFWRMVSEKRNVSCGTKPMLLRSADRVKLRMGWPSIRTVPGSGVVEAGDETDQRGFSGAGGAYDGEAGSRRNTEVDVVEDGRGVGIGEGEVAEFDVACDGRVGGHGSVGYVGLLLQELVDADDGGGAALEEVDDPADGDEGPGELHHVDVEGGELADRDAVRDDLVAADQKGDHEGEAEDELERGPEHGHEADEVEAAA